MRYPARVFRAFLSKMNLRRSVLQGICTAEEKELLGMAPGSHLYDRGWFLSRDLEVSVDAAGAAIPWMTYPFLDFVKNRFSENFRVFEYGSGNSTVYFSQRVKNVVAVEHDLNWFNKVKENIPENVQLVFQPLDEDGVYARSCRSQGQYFQIIVVDGRDRVNCIKYSAECLTGDGVLILDNSDREDYRPAYDFMRKNGFKYLEFWGMVPIVNYTCCTTVFYRTDNCLEI